MKNKTKNNIITSSLMIFGAILASVISLYFSNTKLGIGWLILAVIIAAGFIINNIRKRKKNRNGVRSR